MTSYLALLDDNTVYGHANKAVVVVLLMLLLLLSSRGGKANPGKLYTPLSDSNLSDLAGHLINLANLTGLLIPFRIVSLVTRSIVSEQKYPLLLL